MVFEGEAHAVRSGRLEHAGLAAGDRLTSDEDHGDEVDPVAVGTLGCRSADALGRVDAKRMRLDVPAAPGRRSHTRDAAAEVRQQITPHGGARHPSIDRLDHRSRPPWSAL